MESTSCPARPQAAPGRAVLHLPVASWHSPQCCQPGRSQGRWDEVSHMDGRVLTLVASWVWLTEQPASPQLLPEHQEEEACSLEAPEALSLCFPAWSLRCPPAPGALFTARKQTGVLGSGGFSHCTEWVKMNSVNRVKFTPWRRLPDVCPAVLSTAGSLLPGDPETGEHLEAFVSRARPVPEQPLCFVLQADHPRRVPHAPGGLPNGRACLPP